MFFNRKINFSSSVLKLITQSGKFFLFFFLFMLQQPLNDGKSSMECVYVYFVTKYNIHIDYSTNLKKNKSKKKPTSLIPSVYSGSKRC